MNINGNVENNKDILATKCFTMIKNMYSETYSELLNIFYQVLSFLSYKAHMQDSKN